MMLRAVLLAAVLLGPCAAAETVRISVFGLFRPAEFSLRPAGGGTLVLDLGGESIALEGAQEARVRLERGSLECAVRSRSYSVKAVRAAGRDGRAADLMLAVPGKIERRFNGVLEITAAGAVVEMDLETAVASVVAAESPPGAPPEALKAQAVAARSYYTAARERHAGFGFCDTTHCQFLREPPAPGSAASNAASATRGLLLTYAGEPLAALFSASCGGRTRSLEEVGLRPGGSYTYFPVECPYCRQHAEGWETRLPAEGLPAPDNAERFRIEAGRRLGWSAVPGNDYEAVPDGETIVLRGRGAGHGVGLCQHGAMGMAARGLGFEAILRHYYPNTALAGKDTK